MVECSAVNGNVVGSSPAGGADHPSSQLDTGKKWVYNINMTDDDEKFGVKFGAWLNQGIDEGWVTEPFCNTHDLDPAMGEEEQAEWDEGGDPCQHVLRIMV